MTVLTFSFSFRQIQFSDHTHLRIIAMRKVEKSAQRQETKSQSVAPKYRELSDSELEIVCGGRHGSAANLFKYVD
jgi:hypothetical protein